MLLSNIKLLQGAILIQPTQEATSSFSTETKRYDRKAIGIIRGMSMDKCIIFPFHEGDKVIFDDSKSIDFTIDGTALSIVYPMAIVAIIKEDK